MKTKLAPGLILVSLLAPNSYGAAHSSQINPSNEGVAITIGVYNYAKSGVLFEAQRTATAILRKAGVEARWLSCPTDDASTRIPACATTDPTHLTLRILPDSMSSRWQQVSGDTFGFAVVAGKELTCDAWILYDRARDFTAQHQLTLASLLGSVIAHELGHLLLGENSHSKAGLMRAQWSREELLAIECGQLVFSVAECERMQRAVMIRRQLVSAAIAEVSSLNPERSRN